MQTANGGTGSKSQTTEGQLCPALDSPPAGSTWLPLAANWEQHRNPGRVAREEEGRGAWTARCAAAENIAQHGRGGAASERWGTQPEDTQVSRATAEPSTPA